jgi:hypothetical protein
MRSPRSYIPPIVRGIAVDFEPIPPGSWTSSRKATGSDIQDLHIICSKLSSVQSLALRRVGNRASPLRNSIISAISLLENVEHLKLESIVIQATQDFIKLVCMFPLLKTLSLRGLHWVDPVYPIGLETLQLPRKMPKFRLRDLMLQGARNFTEVLRWFLTQDPVPFIDTLHCKSSPGRNATELSQMLTLVGTSISRLNLTMTNGPRGK